MSHWEQMLEKTNEWIEYWHALRPDADFRKVSENKLPSPDNIGLTESYEAMRSSPETTDIEPQPRQRSSSLGNKPLPKSVLVYPGDNDGNLATFPRRSVDNDPSKLDDEKFKALTNENTKLNRGNGSSLSSLNDNNTTPVKKV